jgi:hypothetical protein
MATVAASARYGTGVYGTSSYGVINISTTLTGVAATGAIGTVEDQTTERLDSVSATGTVQALAQVKVSERLDSVSATGTINAPQVNNKLTLADVSATGAIEPVSAGGFEIDISERITDGVSATGAVQALSQVKVSERLASVSVTGTVAAIIPHADSQITLSSVSATGQVNELEEQTTERLDSVSATGSVGSVITAVSERLDSTSATGTIGNITTTAVIFDFQAVREQYSRRRTVYIAEAA